LPRTRGGGAQGAVRAWHDRHARHAASLAWNSWRANRPSLIDGPEPELGLHANTGRDR
jgi:hypothetical protein